MTEDKRERLLRACRTVVARAGVAGATVAGIAAEAGITPGLVHYYFPSKQALVHALFDRLVDDFAERLSAAGSDAVTSFVQGALALGDGADPEGVRVWGWLAAEALHDEELRARVHAVVEGWLGRLAVTLEAQGIAAPRALAGAIVSGVLGAWQLGTVAPGLLPRGSAADAQRRLVEALIASTEVDRG